MVYPELMQSDGNYFLCSENLDFDLLTLFPTGTIQVLLSINRPKYVKFGIKSLIEISRPFSQAKLYSFSAVHGVCRKTYKIELVKHSNVSLTNFPSVWFMVRIICSLKKT